MIPSCNWVSGDMIGIINKFTTVENEFRLINDYIQRSTILQQYTLRCVLESSKTLSTGAALGTQSTASRPQNIALNSPSLCPGSTIVEAPSVSSFKARINKHWKGEKWSNIKLKAVGSMTNNV